MLKQIILAAALSVAALPALADSSSATAASFTTATSLRGVAVSTDTAQANALTIDSRHADVSAANAYNSAASFTLGVATTTAAGFATAHAYVR